ncbi:MAG TPA: ABC-type transport auxiliary lipoprotein family protein [Burkholderiales bacterium]|nr:ABC-type transport auxiliary lipoprotein family protein [Burkholderiales bacterium]
MKRLLLSFGLLCLSACALSPPRQTEMTAYDFGPVQASQQTAANPRMSGRIVVDAVTAPAWMDSSGMYYRLAYQNAASPQRYAESRWVMSPAALFATRLKSRMAQAREGMVVRINNSPGEQYKLTIELDEFDQIFDRPDRSRVVISLRVTLRSGDGSRVERVFDAEEAAPTPDAAGGARALTQASDGLIQRIIDWVAGAQWGAPPEQAASLKAIPTKVQ